ncbi:hypothetical protein [Mucilaginibacter sp.]
MRKILLLLSILSVTLCVKAQPYSKGRYYDTDGHRHDGFVSLKMPVFSYLKGKGDYIKFKITVNSKEIKIKTDRFIAVAIENTATKLDTFVVSKAPELEDSPILKVIFAGETSLYTHTIILSANMHVGY